MAVVKKKIKRVESKQNTYLPHKIRSRPFYFIDLPLKVVLFFTFFWIVLTPVLYSIFSAYIAGFAGAVVPFFLAMLGVFLIVMALFVYEWRWNKHDSNEEVYYIKYEEPETDKLQDRNVRKFEQKLAKDVERQSLLVQRIRLTPIELPKVLNINETARPVSQNLSSALSPRELFFIDLYEYANKAMRDVTDRFLENEKLNYIASGPVYPVYTRGNESTSSSFSSNSISSDTELIEQSTVYFEPNGTRRIVTSTIQNKLSDVDHSTLLKVLEEFNDLNQEESEQLEIKEIPNDNVDSLNYPKDVRYIVNEKHVSYGKTSPQISQYEIKDFELFDHGKAPSGAVKENEPGNLQWEIQKVLQDKLTQDNWHKEYPKNIQYTVTETVTNYQLPSTTTFSSKNIGQKQFPSKEDSGRKVVYESTYIKEDQYPKKDLPLALKDHPKTHQDPVTNQYQRTAYPQVSKISQRPITIFPKVPEPLKTTPKYAKPVLLPPTTFKPQPRPKSADPKDFPKNVEEKVKIHPTKKPNESVLKNDDQKIPLFQKLYPVDDIAKQRSGIKKEDTKRPSQEHITKQQNLQSTAKKDSPLNLAAKDAPKSEEIPTPSNTLYPTFDKPSSSKHFPDKKVCIEKKDVRKSVRYTIIREEFDGSEKPTTNEQVIEVQDDQSLVDILEELYADKESEAPLKRIDRQDSSLLKVLEELTVEQRRLIFDKEGVKEATEKFIQHERSDIF